MLTVTKIFKFEAAHWLPFYDGACHNLHGHSYKLEVTVTGEVKENVKNPQCGMIIDFSV
ncbi:6-carboxytetrahydropterin synthase, partial [bacterium]|nr:6-carboxytetrahydropterin synthase [bacterium]